MWETKQWSILSMVVYRVCTDTHTHKRMYTSTHHILNSFSKRRKETKKVNK